MFGKWFKKKNEVPAKAWMFVNTVYIDFVDNLYNVRCPVCLEITYVVNNLPKTCPKCHSKLSGVI